MIVTIPACGQFGIVRDQAPQELPPNSWSNGKNVRFQDGYARRFDGMAQTFSNTSVTPYFLTPLQVGSTRYWVHAGLAAVYVDDGTTRTDITGTTPTGAIDDRWTGGALSGLLVLNNAADVPMYWDGSTSTNLTTLTGWDSTWRAKSLRPFKNYLVGLDITKNSTRYPYMVKWSHSADPGSLPTSWDEADASLDAGEVDLAETPDVLIDQLPLGDRNVLYKESSMYDMQYIGGTFIWRFTRLPGSIGMLARGCAAETPMGHVVLSAGDLIVHNGQGPKSILSGRMRSWLFNTLDASVYQRSFVTHNPARNEVWACFPESGATACTLALVWNYKDDTLAVRELPSVTYGASGPMTYASAGTWAGQTDTWETITRSWGATDYSPADHRLLFCRASDILITDSGSTNDGTAYDAYLERTGLAFDDPFTVKTVRAVFPRIEGPAGQTVTIEVGGSMDAETGPTWSAPVTYTIGSSLKADAYATGRFLSLRIKSTGSFAWRIKSIDMDIIKRGAY
jgi:hypothetical protein